MVRIWRLIPSALVSQLPQYRWPLWQVPRAKALGARASRETRVVIDFIVLLVFDECKQKQLLSDR